MTKTLCKIVDTTERRTQTLEFAYFDSKNREVGIWSQTYEVDAIWLGAEAKGGYDMEPGHYYVVRAQTTRGGERFGASQSANYFKTKAEQESYLAKRIGAGLKAAAKNFG